MVRVNFRNFFITVILVTILQQSHLAYASDITNIHDILSIFDRISWEFSIDRIKRIFPNKEWRQTSFVNAKIYLFFSEIDNEPVSICFLFSNDGELARIAVPFLFINNVSSNALCKKYLDTFKQHYGHMYDIVGDPSKAKNFSYIWNIKDSIILLGINPKGQLTIHKIRRSKAFLIPKFDNTR